MVGTPCYVVSEACIEDNLRRLLALQTSPELKHWVSLKTLPVARLVRWAVRLGLGVEVVSEYELSAVLSEGVPASQILVNGVGKASWLHKCQAPEITVHFDSVREVMDLTAMAKQMKWRIGLRCAVPRENKGASASASLEWDQFGMSPEELKVAVSNIGRVGAKVSGLHFHLRTSIGCVDSYREAIDFVADIADELRIEPAYLDIGGGLPVHGETQLDGSRAVETFDFEKFRRLLSRVPLALPSIRAIWMENGRFLTGSSAVLVMSVLERKERGDAAYVICNGGRVNHARVAASEVHEILLLPVQPGPRRRTVLCGPTCSAIDRLGVWMLPESLKVGDIVIWMNAGAYHIPLETRFSGGYAPVVWVESNHNLQIVRHRETPQEWWSQWDNPSMGYGRLPHQSRV